MISHLLCIGGTWMIADGVSSIWQYTKPGITPKQTWRRDHAFRLVRMAWGVVFIYLGIIIG